MDNAFAKKGKYYFSNGKYNEVKDVVIGADESVYVLIETGLLDSVRDMDIIILKLTPQGVPDAQFGEGGIVQFDFHGLYISRAGEMHLQPDGKILVAGDGVKGMFPDINYSCLARLLPDGSPDPDFGNNGTVTVKFDKVSFLTSLAPANDSSVFICGSYNQPVGSHIDVFPVIGKLNKEGVPDTTFRRTGKMWIDFNFQIFSFASVKHTAGGGISDVVVQKDGKILVCGGFIFAYTYEGFIARFLPNGTLDTSFNAKGYFRYDFTPGKYNYIKRVGLYDDHTLVFAAASQTDFDSDFYLGVMNLNDYTFKISHIDFNGQHDILEDMSIMNNEVILCGRSILSQNVPLGHRSNYAAVARVTNIKDPITYETFLYTLSDKDQNGLMAHAGFKDAIVIGGFEHTSNVYMKNVVVSRLLLKKGNKKKK
ncbi:MAG TPA: delta-60 repeat domain-containing protein [Cytophagaceae bacterium]